MPDCCNLGTRAATSGGLWMPWTRHLELISAGRSATGTSLMGASRPRPISRAPPQTARRRAARPPFPSPGGQATTLYLGLSADSIELLIAAGFAEVWLAKEGHPGNIFINFLHKIELPLIYALYGAMLAGVDGVAVGAGNPEGLPAICSQLANHEAVTRNLSVLYRDAAEEVALVV